MLTHKRLHELFLYNPKTGVFRHRIAKGNRAAFAVAGSRDRYGYVLVTADGKTYLGHHLAWFYVYGVWPEELDHRDNRKDHNAIGNLREATRSQNQANRPVPLNNTSGYKGVVASTTKGKWVAQTKKKGKSVYFGTWPTPELAAAAYNIGMKKLHGGHFTPQKIS